MKCQTFHNLYLLTMKHSVDNSTLNIQKKPRQFKGLYLKA